MNNNRFIRIEELIGNNSFQSLQQKTVMIIGVGGVGGMVAEVLGRNGINRIIIIDKDKVEYSNINRQLIALESTVGLFKVDVLKERLKLINPNCEVLGFSLELNGHNINSFFMESVDFVIDAIDDVDAKVEIIEYCTKKMIPFLSSMGTAKKMDPYKLKIMKMNQTSYDPLASKLRYILRKKNCSLDFPVLSSNESPLETENKILASYMPVTSVAGILIADYVIKYLLQGENKNG